MAEHSIKATRDRYVYMQNHRPDEAEHHEPVSVDDIQMRLAAETSTKTAAHTQSKADKLLGSAQIDTATTTLEDSPNKKSWRTRLKKFGAGVLIAATSFLPNTNTASASPEQTTPDTVLIANGTFNGGAQPTVIGPDGQKRETVPYPASVFTYNDSVTQGRDAMVEQAMATDGNDKELTGYSQGGDVARRAAIVLAERGLHVQVDNAGDPNTPNGLWSAFPGGFPVLGATPDTAQMSQNVDMTYYALSGDTIASAPQNINTPLGVVTAVAGYLFVHPQYGKYDWENDPRVEKIVIADENNVSSTVYYLKTPHPITTAAETIADFVGQPDYTMPADQEAWLEATSPQGDPRIPRHAPAPAPAPAPAETILPQQLSVSVDEIVSSVENAVTIALDTPITAPPTTTEELPSTSQPNPPSLEMPQLQTLVDETRAAIDTQGAAINTQLQDAVEPINTAVNQFLDSQQLIPR